MKKYVFHIFLIAVIAGCKNNYQKVLEGEWVLLGENKKGANRLFSHIMFNGDSIQLRDEDYIDYYSEYKIKNDSIYIGSILSEFKIFDDSTIELFGQVFAKKGYLHAIEDYNIYNDISICLPRYILLEDTGKLFFGSNKGERIENIRIGINSAKETFLIVQDQKINFNRLKTFLEVDHRDWRTPIVARLVIDKSASMGFVDSVFAALDSIGIFRLSFVLGNNLNKYFEPIYQLKIIKPPHAFSLLSDGLSDINLPLKKYFGEANNHQQLINIENNILALNGKESDSASVLNSVLASIVDLPSKTSIVLLYNSNTTYDCFIKHLITIHNGCDALRNELSYKKFKTKYKDLNEEQKKTIRNEIPKRVDFFGINLFNKLKKMPFPYCG